jgi:hypothetical protein
MVAVLTEAPPAQIAVAPQLEEYDRIQCAREDCRADSGFPDDADEGAWAAYDQGWHISDFNRDTCGCPHLCADCAHDWCGVMDDSPRLIGMRVVG